MGIFMVTKILLLGDILPLENSIFNINTEVSLFIFNLEAPIINKRSSPKSKAGPSLHSRDLILPKVSSDTNIVANLANNHIMDYGVEGLKSTIKECEKKNILTVGAGENLIESRSPQIIEIENNKIGIIGCCEKQFGASTNWKAGVSVFGPWVYYTIKELKKRVDTVIVSIHGASEMSSWPSPEWQDLLRGFIDAGASIIHGHHSHVPQGFEEYNGGLIFYGLGNFVVDPNIWKDTPNTMWSMIPRIDLLTENQKYQVKTAVIEQKGNSTIIRESLLSEYNDHCQYLKICNDSLKDKRKLMALWQEVSIRQYYLYYAQYLNFPEKYHIQKRDKLKRRVRLIFNSLDEILYGKRNISTIEELLLWYNLFACESHSNAIATSLGVLSGELEDQRTEETRELVDQMMLWSQNWQRKD